MTYRRLTPGTAPEQFIGAYGPRWTRGLLTEHADLFERAGGRLRLTPSGDHLWAVLPDGRAYPVLCSELVEVQTEDGPIVGRCGNPASNEDGLCPAHDYLSPLHTDYPGPEPADHARYAATAPQL